MSTQNPTFAQPAQDSKPAAGAASSMSGKNALLARIQAAKARSQQTAAKPAPTVDLLDLGAPTPAPAATTDNSDLLGGGSSPPPPATVAAPTATDSSATFESLMATTTQPQPQPQPSPVAEVPASSASSAAPEIDEDILAALPPEEREALLEEQRRIMEEIEKKKITTESSGAAARAMAFNQRSSAAVADFAAEGESFQAPAFARPPATPAAATATPNGNTVDLGHGEVVPIYGNEETQEAIKDGTALVVQCMNCQSWMQVTGEANLMLCPSCGVVVPVEKSGAATTANMETAAQVAADQQLAEELQKEEYKQAAGQQRQRERRVEGPAPNGKSWMEWIAGTPAPAPGASAPTTSASPRSPGSEERQGLIGSPNRPATAAAGGARVAQQPQSIFACVAGSVAAAAEQMTGISLTEDKEGNVHGVDSSSLLTMP